MTKSNTLININKYLNKQNNKFPIYQLSLVFIYDQSLEGTIKICALVSHFAKRNFKIQDIVSSTGWSNKTVFQRFSLQQYSVVSIDDYI